MEASAKLTATTNGLAKARPYAALWEVSLAKLRLVRRFAAVRSGIACQFSRGREIEARESRDSQACKLEVVQFVPHARIVRHVYILRNRSRSYSKILLLVAILLSYVLQNFFGQRVALKEMDFKRNSYLILLISYYVYYINVITQIQFNVVTWDVKKSCFFSLRWGKVLDCNNE